MEYTDPMALAFGFAADGKYAEAVKAGQKALQVIIDTRAIEPASYYTLSCGRETSKRGFGIVVGIGKTAQKR